MWLPAVCFRSRPGTGPARDIPSRRRRPGAEGCSPLCQRRVLAHGVIDYRQAIVGPAVEAADHMQEWFEAGAADGFRLSPDVFEDGIDAFVDGVAPNLQKRGLFHRDYEGTTLRDHLGAPAQYGLDPRVSG